VEKGMLQFLELGQLMENVGLYGNSLERKDIIGLGGSLGKFISENGVRRLVIDSFSGILHGVEDPTVARDFMLALSEVLYDNECTGMLISDTDVCETVESVIADGVIVMGNYVRHSDLLRTIQVVKMKGTSHSRAKYAIDLTSCGILTTPLLRGGGQ
jgi:circadian clock protein KaiC